MWKYSQMFNKTPDNIFKIVKTFIADGPVDPIFSFGRPKITSKSVYTRRKTYKI